MPLKKTGLVLLLVWFVYGTHKQFLKLAGFICLVSSGMRWGENRKMGQLITVQILVLTYTLQHQNWHCVSR